MTINSKRKGAQGERELARELREYGYGDSHRTQQYCGAGEDASDVVGLPGVHCEVKRVEKLNVSNAVRQAVRDADEGKLPAVFHRKNREEWLVTVRLADFMAIYQEYASGVLLSEKAVG